MRAVHATGTLEAAGQEPDQDPRDAEAKHSISGVAVTWDAEQIFYLPASAGRS